MRAEPFGLIGNLRRCKHSLASSLADRADNLHADNMEVHLIPYTNTTVKVESEVTKEVACEQCRARFKYSVTVRAAGDHVSLLASQRAQMKAEEVAQKKLQVAMSSAVDLVACPVCGWFQAHMIRAKRWKCMKIAALCALLTPMLITTAYTVFAKELVRASGFGTILVGTIAGAFAVAFAIALVIMYTFRPNSGRFGIYSRKNINRAVVLAPRE